jgi:hypothetical protein
LVLAGTALLPISARGDASLRQIMALEPQFAATEEPATASTDAPDGAASKRYYQAINDMLDDLQKSAKGKNYAQSALSHENFARKIGLLSITRVDPAMVKYGESVASHLRAIAASLRGEGIQLARLESQKRWYWYEEPPSVSYYYGGWWGRRPGRSHWNWGVAPGRTYYNDNFAEMRAKQAEAIAKGETDRLQICSHIEQERMEVRRKMLEGYQIDVAEREGQAVRRR